MRSRGLWIQALASGGLAGLRSALEVDGQLSTLVITKGSLEQSNSVYAQGGVAAVLAPDDSFEEHIADTLEVGGALCDRRLWSTWCARGPSESTNWCR